MSIIRYNSLLNDYRPTSFSNLIDRFFNDAVTRSGGTSYAFVPRVDIFENETNFELQLAVPGVDKNDFKIDLNENVLTISGERKLTKEVKENHFRSLETQFGTFSRSFTLPENVDAEKISARYVDGILEVLIPKDEKKAVKTTIKVN